MNCLREFVSSVLEDDFPVMRYSTEKNSHLRKVFNSEKGRLLKEEWENGTIYENVLEPSPSTLNKGKSPSMPKISLKKKSKKGY